MREYGGWVYILASKRNGTLYTGVTNKLFDRVSAYKAGVDSKFTRKYGVTMLVWFEAHDRIESAIQRETSIKRWPRKWKLALIEQDNPEWNDLFDKLGEMPPLPIGRSDVSVARTCDGWAAGSSPAMTHVLELLALSVG